MIYCICYILAFIPLLLMFGWVKVIGKNKITKNNKYIIACNHMSSWDPIVLMFKRTLKIKFLAKKELANTRFNAWFMRQMGGIAIDRQNPELTSIKTVLRVLKDNKPVCIFPTGTRKTTPKVNYEDIKDGVALFSIKAQAPVVPAMYVNKLKPFKRNVLLIGDPISYEGFTTQKESIELYSHLICDKMNKLLEDYFANINK